MFVLVAYATRHGATRGIAERIASTLLAAGVPAEARPCSEIRDPSAYDAFVIGGAAYMFHWHRDAARFVRRHRALLATRPVWLFSSGPLGDEPTDDKGNDLRRASIPREIPELAEAVHARDHHVFFGAYSREQKPIGLGERFVALLPATRDAMPDGDFRDWPEIEGWAAGIAAQLQAAGVAR